MFICCRMFLSCPNLQFPGTFGSRLGRVEWSLLIASVPWLFGCLSPRQQKVYLFEKSVTWQKLGVGVGGVGSGWY